MRKLLLAIDGSERSLNSIELVKSRYSPNDVEITLLIVREDLDNIRSHAEYGQAGEEILLYAMEKNIDAIVMTKSTKRGWSRIIGSVTTYVVKYSSCLVVIVPER